ncbi:MULTISPECIES: hypothetical protein [unclassified Bradyrhizobium]|uniref:hypothetical protein n=1 Tax=unclassified Bradyrhizobium TaxID=2631580 RepID=UPI00339692FF
MSQPTDKELCATVGDGMRAEVGVSSGHPLTEIFAQTARVLLKQGVEAEEQRTTHRRSGREIN